MSRRLALSPAALDIRDIEQFKFATLDLRDRRTDPVVFALALLQEIKRDADHFSWFLIKARCDLCINKLRLLRGKSNRPMISSRPAFSFSLIRAPTRH